MKPCPQYAADLAAYAGGGKEPEPALKAHLQDCPACREACEELRRAATLQTRIAAQLPNPGSHPRLDGWFLDQVTGTSRRSGRKPVLGALRASALAIGIALLLVASFGLFFAWNSLPRESAPVRSLVKNASMAELRSGIDLPAPSWRQLRHELVSDGRSCERPYRGMGSLVNPYRLKDAYFTTD
jgi:hypothetical protein